MNIEPVYFPYLSDLVYRIQNLGVCNSNYTLDYLDWVKAGLAFNRRGSEDPSRKVSYFGELLSFLNDSNFCKKARCEGTKEQFIVNKSLQEFYRDLFDLYQYHIVAQKSVIKENGNEGLGRLVIIPKFEAKSELFESFEREKVVFHDRTLWINNSGEEISYSSSNENELMRIIRGKNLYAANSHEIVSFMSLFYDLSRGTRKTKIMEVAM